MSLNLKNTDTYLKETMKFDRKNNNVTVYCDTKKSKYSSVLPQHTCLKCKEAQKTESYLCQNCSFATKKALRKKNWKPKLRGKTQISAAGILNTIKNCESDLPEYEKIRLRNIAEQQPYLKKMKIARG